MERRVTKARKDALNEARIEMECQMAQERIEMESRLATMAAEIARRVSEDRLEAK
jgi:hypothetical protein